MVIAYELAEGIKSPLAPALSTCSLMRQVYTCQSDAP